MINVLTSTQPIVENSKNVSIKKEKIASLVKVINQKDFKLSEISLSKKNWPLEILIQIIFVFNSINFCYWAKKGENKWTVNIGNEQLDGSIALFRCIEKEVERNTDFLTGDELADLSRADLKRILTGNVTIPLFEERRKCLNEAGRVLEKYFNNFFLNVYRKANNNAMILAGLLINYFPCFNDIAKHGGKDIAFYKRAQLNSKMISDVLLASGRKGLINLDKLTAFADYKIPQILRNLEIIEYSLPLSSKIDSFELIKSGSREEIEIRAATVWAVEFIKKELQKKFDFVTASHVDNILWNMSQTKTKGEKPYHRTLTIAY